MTAAPGHDEPAVIAEHFEDFTNLRRHNDLTPLIAITMTLLVAA
jgi:hypothetical protein